MAKLTPKAVRAYLASKSEREQYRLMGSRGVPVKAGRRGHRLKSNRRWQAWEIKLLGKMPDREACRKTGRALTQPAYWHILEVEQGVNIHWAINGVRATRSPLC